MSEDRLEELDQADVWSVSALKTIGSCGRQFEFRYRQEAVRPEATPPLAFGSAVHRCIERLHKEGDKWEPRDWQRMWNDEWFTYASKVEWHGRGYNKTTFDKLGATMIANYIERNRDADVLEIEWKFPAKENEQYCVGKYPVKGIVDQVRRQKNGRLLVVDLKTSKDVPHPLLLRADPQFTIYWHCVQQKYNEPVDLAWLHLRTGELITTQRKEADLKILEEALREAQLRVDNRLFARNVGFACKFCPFITQCLGPMSESDHAE